MSGTEERATLTHLGGDLWGRPRGRYVDICDRDGCVMVFMTRRMLEAALEIAPPEETSDDGNT